MSRARVDISGRVFGTLTVVKFIRMNASHQAIYLCQCTCGRRRRVFAANLMSDRTQSCGHSHAKKRGRQA